MKREEKNALSRQRILTAAMKEFSAHGYEGASLNAVCAENEISKGIIYHYFKDKDELYLVCVEECFQALTGYLAEARGTFTGTTQQQLNQYFDVRLRFFVGEPLYLGIFVDAVLNSPLHLSESISEIRKDFDLLNISILTNLLSGAALQPGIRISEFVEDFEMYMDYFNIRFQKTLKDSDSGEEALQKHEEQCHRQLKILLYGILSEEKDEQK